MVVITPVMGKQNVYKAYFISKKESLYNSIDEKQQYNIRIYLNEKITPNRLTQGGVLDQSPTPIDSPPHGVLDRRHVTLFFMVISINKSVHKEHCFTAIFTHSFHQVNDALNYLYKEPDDQQHCRSIALRKSIKNWERERWLTHLTLFVS